MADGVTYRDYTEADRKAVEAHLVEFQDHERAVEPEYLPGREVARPYLNSLLYRLSSGSGRLVVAAAPDGTCIGYTCFLLARPTHLVSDLQVEVTDLYVAPAWRGCGAGRAMLALADAYARERWAARVILTTLARNAAGRAMYARCGFREFEVTLVRPVAPAPNT